MEMLHRASVDIEWNIGTLRAVLELRARILVSRATLQSVGPDINADLYAGFHNGGVWL